MGRIKKAAGPKHEATVSPAVSDFVSRASSFPISALPEILNSFPKRWPLPRGDLYHWIPLLNRFDNILEQFNRVYGLDAGPQSKPFGIVLLSKGIAAEDNEGIVKGTSREELEHLDFGDDGDRQLVEHILRFSRTLLENCGNRSLYGSSERLSELLNTTSLPLLSTVLQLMVRLAQRYHASRQRTNSANQTLNNALLASHYNIDLEKVQKLAEPFVKLPSSYHTTPQTPSGKKGKEKATSSRHQAMTANANDMLSLIQPSDAYMNGSANHGKTAGRQETESFKWEDWGGVSLTYYPTSGSKDNVKQATPTPSRRGSSLSKPSRLSSSDETAEISPNTSGEKPEGRPTAMANLEITSDQIKAKTIENLLSNPPTDLPKDVQYDLLTKSRVAYAVITSVETRQEIVGIRLLALTNLAYIYSEENFKQKILQRDSDEPRNLQLVQLLSNMLHPLVKKPNNIPIKLQTFALGTLESLAKLKTTAPDVCTALSVNVNHGVLFLLLRKAVADMGTESKDPMDVQLEEWREAVFALLDTLPTSTPRTGEALISAGVLGILVELLNLRTSKAERSFPKTLTFLNNLIAPARDAFQTLANANGLEAISDLMAYEVKTSIERAENGQGLQPDYRNRVVDYQIPFFGQQTLRMIFKIIREMMTNNSGNFDRLLRNFIDSPSLLSGLRTVIVNPKVFGSNVWSGAVNIMSSFIHNEPTSYAVISEAGLSKGLLETLSTKPVLSVKVGQTDDGTEDSNEGTAQATDNIDDLPDASADTEKLMTYFASKMDTEFRPEGVSLAKGVLPATEPIIAIPHAFGALCLNRAGMDMLKKTDALDNFFEIFESPAHVRVMTSEQELGQLIGQALEELVRHHPTLKILVLCSVIKMINRVKNLCLALGQKNDTGAKIWVQDNASNIVAPGEAESAHRLTESDGDVLMNDLDTSRERPAVQKAPHSDPSDADEEDEPTLLSYIAAAMRFLSGFAENQATANLLADSGIVELVLEMATLPVLVYDYNTHSASIEIRRVLHVFAEAKPHLVLPTLLQYTQSAVDRLAPLHSHTGPSSFFADFTSPTSNYSKMSTQASSRALGTMIVRSLVSVHTLCNILGEIFSHPPFNTRTTQTPFSLVNLTDIYINLIKDLGSLHRVCVWEEILLMRRLPEHWNKATQFRGYGMGSAEADKIFGFSSSDDDLPGLESVPEMHGPGSSSLGPATTPSTSRKSITLDDMNSAAFKNSRVLRFLLGQIPAATTPFFRSLGKSLLGKRRSHTPDPYLRQNASMVANAISSAYMQMFTYEPPHDAEKMQRYSYWIVILTSISRLLIEGGSPRMQTQVLTLLLQAFRQDGGLDIIKSILEKFHEEVDSLSNSSGDPGSKDNAACLFTAYRGIQVILNFYTPILSHKSIVDASQSEAMRSAETQPGRAFYFNPQQFLVDLQIIILPVIKSLWESAFVEKASSEIVKSVIELMKIILDSSEEHGIPRQNPETSQAVHKAFEISEDKVAWLKAKGIDEDMAQEALYRCMNAQHFALAYCQRLRSIQGATRLPVPEYDKISPRLKAQGDSSTAQDSQSSQATQPESDVAVQSTIDDDTTAAATGLALLSQGDRLPPSVSATPQVAVEEAGHESQTSTEMPPPPAPGVPADSNTNIDAGGHMEMSLDNLQNMLPDVQAQATADLFQRLNDSLAGTFSTGTQSQSGPPAAGPSSKMTIEDLNSGRNEVRKTLVDRALDVLNAHDDVTFELADLIGTATSKTTDVKAVRTEIGATLIQSLISFELGEDYNTSGRKIAAYANLLALVLQSKDFFEACSNELKDNFEYLVGFIHLPPNQTAGMATTPWLGQTLLVIERILAEDAQPPQVKPMPPDANGIPPLQETIDSGTSLVSDDAKAELFEALLKLMPSTGKDEPMVLSIVRVLVMITRSRDIASRLAEKKNIQRFFLMIKQLSGMNDDKLTSSVMVVVRHMFEDEETIRRVMRSEIRNGFETRASRSTDATNYARQNNHLAIRSPQLFVEISNEVLEISGYDSTQRPQALRLKQDSAADTLPPIKQADVSTTDDATKDSSEDQTMQDNVQSVDDGQSVNPKSKSSEKAPVVESPSGVIHYLLSELLSYKDTDDSVASLPAKPVKGEPTATATTESGSSGRDAPNSHPPAIEAQSEAASSNNSPISPFPDAKKAELKPEQHPIHTYRCFLLQCLTELLHSYNQAKIEFINFSRKADAKATTPSKPRSGVLNYLLMEAIPIGSLQAEDTISYKKRDMTSTWAMSTIVALCLKTNEHGYDRKPGTVEEDDQPDLVFVRKFVLEHALKAYKDANSSDEDLIIKYGRLLKLADLFHCLLSGALLTKNIFPSTGGLEVGPQKAIAKLMFEKNFIAAMTSSIADISLNLKGADRAIKYILRPLKQLTTTAVELSETASISTVPGQTDEDNISSASSVSEANGREETPDLFRNSTLGMFEANREDDSSSDSSRSEDDEMYEDEYDEGIDYDDGLAEPDNDEVISDEDEELEDVGDIEGFHGGGPGPMEISIEDDEEDPEDDEDEDPDDSGEDDDMEDLEEINGDDENDSLAEGDEEDWQDELDDGEGDDGTYDGGNHDDSHDPDAEDAVRDIVREFGGAEAALQRLEGLDDAPPADLIMDIEEGRYMDDVVRREDDDEAEDDEDDDEEVDDEEYDAVYDDDRTIPDPPWGWDDPDDDPLSNDQHHRHHHHTHRHHLSRHLPDPWTIFPGGPPRRTPLHQTHRTPTTGFRPNDDGTNPLLHRNDRHPTSTNPRRSAFSDGTASLGGVLSGPLGGPLGGPLMAGIGVGPPGSGHRESPVTMIHDLIAAIGRSDSGITAVPGPGGDLHIQIASDGSMDPASLHRGVQAMMAGTRFMQRQMHPSDSGRSDVRSSLTAFVPQSTWQRWADEAKMLFGVGEVQNKGARVVNALLRLMIPPALEKKKQQDEEEKKRREEMEKLREEERKLREEAERIQREQREKEEAEAAAAAAAAAQAQAEAEAEAAAASRESEDAPEEAGGMDTAEGAMEGVETNDTHAESPAPDNGNEGAEQQQTEVPTSTQPAERQYVSFNGTQLDITDMGIDMAYLDALPEDIRNEVLMSQLAMQRAQTAATGEAPTEIDNDFLEALPADIRAELLQEEAQVRRRREREEARRQQASTGGPAHAEEMDPASFLASLDPTLRQHVLMEQDDEVLARLPAEIAAEARALGGDRSMHRFAGGPRITRPSDMRRDMLVPPPQAVKKQPRRQIVQMLDRSGVATLLRLMFMQQPGNVKNPLHGILHDIVQNRQNRAEVISLLLSLLQDGSTDVNAVERSYNQLSLRAKQVNAPRTPLKRTVTETSLVSAVGITELKITPLMVIQQCLGSLVFLTSHNQQHIPSFFLNENDALFTVKSKANKKGKAKETKASRFPINALLSLLDRQLITENMSCIEQLANLLQKITYPLTMLSRKDSEHPKDGKKDEQKVDTLGQDQQPPTSSPEAASAETNDRNASESANDATDRSSTSPMADIQASDNTEGQQQPTNVDAPGDTPVDNTDEAQKQAEKDTPKKTRAHVPPVIPEENLRLVVNIIVARECPSNTFRATLSTMTNLCAIAGAKDIFGKRLVDSALDLGHHVLNDLNELIPQIQGAASGTELQGMALTKFSPQSSDQAKLLRVLKALDYLFDPKRENEQANSSSEAKEAAETSKATKADLVTSLYEDSTFALLWDKLGECLSAIRQATGMLNVATILLPLVEALMVVCTNTTIKEAPITKAIKEFAITSPPPESRMESLFFRFTEEHRKILNDLVRQNPKLMSGTFQLLVRNPKVLEFDNKRSYFTRRLHQRGAETRHSQPPLQLALRRDQVFRDSYQALFFMSGDEIKYGKLSIRFHGEEGVDAGGVTREWFQVLSRQMFNPDYALFIPVASDRTTFHPNKLSKINEEHLRFFNFIGRIIGKALYEGRALDCHFSRAVYKRILGKTVSIKDMETLDLDYYKSLLWMLENDITEIITETMSVETDDFGVTEVVDLIPNGRNVQVTEENKQEYVQLVVEHRLTGSVQAQLENFLQGFHDIVPPELIAIFDEQELELLISGLPDIDVDDWKNHTEYHNYQAASPQIQWFWRAVRSFDKEERAKLLQFVTGTSKVPLNGFSQLEGMNGFSRFNIHRDYGNKERLPSSHTCFNQLDLPEYEDYETLRKQVYLAMTAGSEYFGFA